VEQLGVAGGWQDHYAAAYGGALALDFGATTRVERIPLAPGLAESIATRCLLIYTGETRISGANISAVLDAYAARDTRVLMALQRMAALARDMALALRAADIDALGRLVAEHWGHQRSLHPAITTARIDEILTRAASAGALGGKALGASGGGCVAVITEADAAPVRSAVAGLGTLLPYSLDFDGAVAEEVT
jgi:D-glycero-alpha-D-manno-heptose-7-phosphate kinase